jgi:hypothetical protein
VGVSESVQNRPATNEKSPLNLSRFSGLLVRIRIRYSRFTRRNMTGAKAIRILVGRQFLPVLFLKEFQEFL